MESQSNQDPTSSPASEPRSSPISLQPARLRTLTADRKRSESLPPSLKRKPLERLMSAPTSTLSTEERTQETSSPKPSSLWTSDNFDDSQKPSYGFCSSSKNEPAGLDNLDDHEFLVDAGVVLTDNTLTTLSTASSLPNLSMNQTNSPPLLKKEKDSSIAKCLISNKEMEEYEKEYERAASTSPKPHTQPSENKYKRSLSASKIYLMKKSGNMSQSRDFSSPPNSSPRSSPKFSLKSSLTDPSPPRRWNDGTIERMAEKWAAKRDTLRRETGFVPENIQGRKAAMEQKLESVKRSIPRSNASSPLQQTSQKRLSLCNDDSSGKSNIETTPKRKSLDFEAIFSSSGSDSNDENGSSSCESQPISPPLKLPSPDFDSSDSDDSLPPYPSMDRCGSDIDDLLPPPPPDIDHLDDIKDLNIKLFRPYATTDSPKLPYRKVTDFKPKPGTFTYPQKSLTSYYKTVPAPHTSVAVSKTLPSPKRSIAGSLKSPADLKPNPDEDLEHSEENDKTERNSKTTLSSKDDSLSQNLYLEPNNNVVLKKQASPNRILSKDLKKEDNRKLISTFSHTSYQTSEESPSCNSVQIVDQVEGPSQVVIKSSSVKQPPRTLKKPGGTFIAIQDKESNKEEQNYENEVLTSTVQKQTSTSTLPRSRLSAGSRSSAQHQRRSYGGALDPKLSTPPTPALKYSSAPSTPRTSTSDLRSMRSPGRSPGRSPIGSSSNLRKLSSDHSSRSKLMMNSKESVNNDKSDVTITSFEKQKATKTSMFQSAKTSLTNVHLTPPAKKASRMKPTVQRYSLELKNAQPVPAHMKSIGGSLDFTSQGKTDLNKSDGNNSRLDIRTVSSGTPSRTISGSSPSLIGSSKLGQPTATVDRNVNNKLRTITSTSSKESTLFLDEVTIDELLGLELA